MTGGVRWVRSGVHFGVGRRVDGYGVWDWEDCAPGRSGEPVAVYPPTPAGRQMAEAAFSACEAARGPGANDGPADGETGVLAVSVDGDEIRVGDLRIGSADIDVTGLLVVEVGDVSARWGLAQAVEVQAAVCEHATAQAADGVELRTADPLLRYLARSGGWTGALRAPLCRPPGVSAHDGNSDVAGQLEALLHGVDVRRRSAAGSLRQVAVPARKRNAGPERFVLASSDGLQIVLVIPDVADLLVENVARSADTALAVMRTVGTHARHVRQIAFNQSTYGLRHAKHAGEAATSTLDININAGYVSACGLDALYAAVRRDRRRGRARQIPYPYNAVDGTTAHEMWHHIEASFTRANYTASIQFRRKLGEYFGLRTLEHLSHPPSGSDPDVLAAAVAQLRAEVSDYATTVPTEATAEMFKAWWCATEPPTGVVSHFAQLVTSYITDA